MKPAVEGPSPLPPGPQRSMLLITTLLIAVMASLDLTIVAVALPYMAGNLSAGPDQITWVVTMFTVGQAISIGMTGFASRLLGRKRLVIVVVIGFVTTSILCALSQSLTQIVLARFVQGFFSGPLIPISQSILVDAFPQDERPKALSFWTVGVVGGPAIGPMIGGYLAQHLTWRWNFWINLPVGAAALILTLIFVRSIPAQRARTDYVGLVLLATMIVCLQVVLDQGNLLDWFSSHMIVYLAITSFAVAIAFFWRGALLGRANIINLTLLKDVNFAVCSGLMGVLGCIFLALLIVTPELLVDYYRWEVQTAGLVMGAGGVAGVVAAMVSGRLVPFLGGRLLIMSGLLITAIGWYFYGGLTLGASPMQVIIPSSLVMFGLLLIIPVLSAQAFQNLPPDQRDEGAGLFNFVKTLGFSFGVAGVDTFIYRGSQQNWSLHAGQVNPTSPPLMTLGDARITPEVMSLVGVEMQRQMGMVTIVQLAQFMVVFALVCLPLAFMLRSPRH